MRFFIILLFILFFHDSAFADKVKIVDGDTIRIGKTRYRLFGIDAPEMKQTCKKGNEKVLCGVLSRNFLIEKVGKNDVKCKKISKDRYDRNVAECFVGDVNLNKYMVRNGYAFAYKRYSKKFVEDEKYAKQNKLGLWQMSFEFPWDYRRNLR